MDTALDPHADQPVLTSGPSFGDAKAALILLHGRGASAESMLDLFDELQVDHVRALALQASGSTWYPQSFLAPLENNQPELESALLKVTTVVNEVLSSGLQKDQVAILGFSQGACLTCEFVARNPRKYGAVMALTGGVIGPPGIKQNYSGTLDGTPVFLGTSDPDMHVPFSRVEETRDIFNQMDAHVELRRYPGMPHTINTEELDVCRAMLQTLVNPERNNL